MSKKPKRFAMTPLVLDLARSLYAGEQDAAGPLHDALEESGAPAELYEHFAAPGLTKDCPDCGGSGELYGEYFSDDGVGPCSRCDSQGAVFNDDDGTHPKGCWALDLLLGKQ